MNKANLFSYLEKQKSSELMRFLKECYDCMQTQDIRNVFEPAETQFLKEFLEDGESVSKDVRVFMEDSLKGVYYATFDMNSKNFTDVPEETDMWFEKLGELLLSSTQLSIQGDHISAVKCFMVLFELIDKMESGAEIIFAHEFGMWMLPIQNGPYIRAYIKSAATVLAPEEYVKVILSLIDYDRRLPVKNKVYKKARKVANKNQKLLLEEKVFELKTRAK